MTKEYGLARYIREKKEARLRVEDYGLVRYMREKKEAAQQESNRLFYAHPDKGLPAYVYAFEKTGVFPNVLNRLEGAGKWLDPKHQMRLNPFARRIFGGTAVSGARKLDRKIDEFNANRNNPDILNRASTHTRDGRLFSVNVPHRQQSDAVDMIDAWNKDPELKGIAPPTIGTRTGLRQLFAGKHGTRPIALPFIRHISINPESSTHTILHEGGHQRDYVTRPFVQRDFVPYIFQQPFQTMRMEVMAEDNAFRLNQLMHPETQLSEEAMLRGRDRTLLSYTDSHDPDRTYGKKFELLGMPDGLQRFIPPDHRALPGQSNWRQQFMDRNLRPQAEEGSR